MFTAVGQCSGCAVSQERRCLAVAARQETRPPGHYESE